VILLLSKPDITAFVVIIRRCSQQTSAIEYELYVCRENVQGGTRYAPATLPPSSNVPCPVVLARLYLYDIRLQRSHAMLAVACCSVMVDQLKPC